MTAQVDDERPGPLPDLRVIDCSTVVAGPGCARYLADFGADVIKVERPDGGDTTRAMGWRDPRDDVTLWWKLAGRNKRTVVLDLKDEADLDRMRRLVDTRRRARRELPAGHPRAARPRPGRPARPQPRSRHHPGHRASVRTARTPQRPGFATLAEAMSGFAAINGEPDGGPLLPPIALTDEVTALVAAFATLVAVHSGVGQVVDVNLLESLFQLMGPLMSRRGRSPATCSRGSARASPTRCRAARTAAPTASGWPSPRRPSRSRRGS